MNPDIINISELFHTQIYQHSNRTKAERLSQIYSSLGWLHGLFHRASTRSLVALVNLTVGSFLWTRKGRRKRKGINESYHKPCNQESIMRTKDIKPQITEPTIDISQLPNQKFVVRKRNNRGQLKHIATFDYPPTQKDLESYGHGDYSVLTTKPSLRQWTRIRVEPEKKLQEPIFRKAGLINDYPPVSTSITPLNVNTQKEINKHFPDIGRESKKSSISEDKTVPLPTPEEFLTSEDIAQMPVPKEIIRQHQIEVNKSKPAIKNSSQSPTEYQLRDSPLIDPQLPPTSSQEKQENCKLVEKKPKVCYKCGYELILFTRCEFCRKIFCDEQLDDCYKLHHCPDSYKCTICTKRIAVGETITDTFCNNPYCSARCLTKCLEKNDNNIECKPCINDSLSEEDELECDESGSEATESDEFLPKCDIELEGNKEIEEKEDREKDDCDGICNDCITNNCKERCELDGICKGCHRSDNCTIQCLTAIYGCEKKYCIGFECETRMPAVFDYVNEVEEEWEESDEE